MAINQHHTFEDLDGVKCGVVEKNVSTERVAFLKELLEANGYTVLVVGTAPPKVAAPAEGEVPAPPPAPTTFTVGVSDVTFNATNAVFGRLLRTKDNHVVTLEYWKQLSPMADDATPYFTRKK
jgi:hypothetical protein